MLKSIVIGVDSKRALEVLSGSVFAGQDESIRELIVNAADSITQLPPHLQLNVQIRLVPRHMPSENGPGILEIRDSGIGMSEEHAERYLGRLFSSSKQGFGEVIGQFGVGFYSCFRLCSKVEVFTRTNDASDNGTKVTYDGGDSMQIGPSTVKRHGTTVVLHLRSEFRKLLERETLVRIVRRYCDFIRYPILLGESGNDMLNEATAPWDNLSRRDEEIRQDLMRLFGVRSPLAVFPVPHTRGRIPKIEGILFIPGVEEPRSLRLYNHRVLITDSDKALLSGTLQEFISGAVDIDDLPLVLSRDAVLSGTPQFKAASERLAAVVSEGLLDMAKTRHDVFRDVMNTYGATIKSASLANDRMFRGLATHFPFRSTTRPAVTIGEYLRDAPSVDSKKTVIYTDNEAATLGLLPLYARHGLEVLFMTDAVDRPLRDRWSSGREPIEFRPMEVDPPESAAANDMERGERVGEAVVETLRSLFCLETRESVVIKLQDLGAEGPPVVLALGDEERKRIAFHYHVLRLQQENRLNELPPEAQEMARSGLLEAMVRITDRTLILNQSAEIVRRLLDLLAPSRKCWVPNQSALPPLIARFLYGQAMICSGLVLSNSAMIELSRDQTAIVTCLLNAPATVN